MFSQGRSIKLGPEKLKELYEVTEIFFCNKEEAQEILNTDEQDVPTLIREFKKLDPTMPVITDGPNGAYAVDEDDQAWHMPMYPDPAPLTTALEPETRSALYRPALGKTPAEALAWGQSTLCQLSSTLGRKKDSSNVTSSLSTLRTLPRGTKQQKCRGYSPDNIQQRCGTKSRSAVVFNSVHYPPILQRPLTALLLRLLHPYRSAPAALPVYQIDRTDLARQAELLWLG